MNGGNDHVSAFVTCIFEESVQEYNKKATKRQSQNDLWILRPEMIGKGEGMAEYWTHHAHNQANRGTYDKPFEELLTWKKAFG